MNTIAINLERRKMIPEGSLRSKKLLTKKKKKIENIEIGVNLNIWANIKQQNII